MSKLWYKYLENRGENIERIRHANSLCIARQDENRREIRSTSR